MMRPPAIARPGSSPAHRGIPASRNVAPRTPGWCLLAVLVLLIAALALPGSALAAPRSSTRPSLGTPPAASSAPARATAAANPAPSQTTVANAQELVAVLNNGAPATAPKAQLTAEGTVKLLAPVTVVGESALAFTIPEAATITLDLAGQNLTLANGVADHGQMSVTGGGTLALVGAGTLALNVPQTTMGALDVNGGILSIACDVTVSRPESATSALPLVRVSAGTLSLGEGGALRQFATESGEDYQDTYAFIHCESSDAQAPASLALRGGTVAVADSHWGIGVSGSGATATVEGGTLTRTVTIEDGDDPYALLFCGDGGSATVSGGSIGPDGIIAAYGGGTATMEGGALEGSLIANGAQASLALKGGSVSGIDGGTDGPSFAAIQIQSGASATMTGGALESGVESYDAGSLVTISGGSVAGTLQELEGGQIAVTPAPADDAPATFSHPVDPAMLEGLGASMLANTLAKGVAISYHPTLAAARSASSAAYGEPGTLDSYCATVSPKAAIAFAGFSNSRAELQRVLAAYADFVGEELDAGANTALLYAFATVTPGQAYTFTFSDGNGKTLGTRTLTAGRDETSLLASLEVETHGPTGLFATTPEVAAGTYTVSVESASGASAAEAKADASEVSFGVSAITYRFNGGAYEGSSSVTSLLLQGRWNALAPTRPGYELTGWTGEPPGTIEYDEATKGWLMKLPLLKGVAVTFTAQWEPETVEVHRLWNPYNGAHLLSTSASEIADLTGLGWQDESVVFSVYGSAFPGSTAVTRLYNPANGDHVYSTNRAEMDALEAIGWTNEGVKFYGSPETTHPVYRLWNSQQSADGGLGSHLWTADRNEYNTLPLLPPVGAWKQESIAWYAVTLPGEAAPGGSAQ